MGIRGLSRYISDNGAHFLSPHNLQDTKLIIDGCNIFYHLYSRIDSHGGAYGAKYDVFAQSTRMFFDEFARCGVEPIVVIDGVDCMSKKTLLQNYQDKLQDDSIMAPLLGEVFIDVLRKMNVQVVQTIGEADDTIVVLARDLNCPVLSADGDFYLCGVKYIPLRMLGPATSLRGDDGAEKWAIRCQMYNFQSLLARFNDLDESLMPLAVVLLGNSNRRDHLDPQDMSFFFQRLTYVFPGDGASVAQRRIESTLKWLSHHSSMSEAVAAVLGCVKKPRRLRVLAKIEKHLRTFCTPSRVALRGLGLSEAQFSRMTTQTETLPEFQEDVERLEVPKLLLPEENSENGAEAEEEDSGLEENEEVDEDEERSVFTEEDVLSTLPGWLIREFTEGVVRGNSIKALMYSALPLVPCNEDPYYEPTSRIAIPVLSFTFGLMTSLTSRNENTLEFYLNKKTQVLKQEETIERSSIQLKDVRDLKLTERRAIVNEALGLDPSETLEELPDTWRLYVATMVFWMRHQAPPRKTTSHLFPVVFAMFFGIIDEKIGVTRFMDEFDRKWDGEYKDIITRRRPSSRRSDEKSLREAMSGISREECIAAAPFFIRHFTMSHQQQMSLPWYSVTVIHIFAQFQICLRAATELNALVGHPYAPAPVQELFNGVLFYNLYEEFTKQDDLDGFLFRHFEYSPAIVQSFIKLKSIVLSILRK